MPSFSKVGTCICRFLGGADAQSYDPERVGFPQDKWMSDMNGAQAGQPAQSMDTDETQNAATALDPSGSLNGNFPQWADALGAGRGGAMRGGRGARGMGMGMGMVQTTGAQQLGSRYGPARTSIVVERIPAESLTIDNIN